MRGFLHLYGLVLTYMQCISDWLSCCSYLIYHNFWMIAIQEHYNNMTFTAIEYNHKGFHYYCIFINSLINYTTLQIFKEMIITRNPVIRSYDKAMELKTLISYNRLDGLYVYKNTRQFMIGWQTPSSWKDKKRSCWVSDPSKPSCFVLGVLKRG